MGVFRPHDFCWFLLIDHSIDSNIDSIGQLIEINRFPHDSTTMILPWFLLISLLLGRYRWVPTVTYQPRGPVHDQLNGLGAPWLWGTGSHNDQTAIWLGNPYEALEDVGRYWKILEKIEDIFKQLENLEDIGRYWKHGKQLMWVVTETDLYNQAMELPEGLLHGAAPKHHGPTDQ